jgi:transcriptional regulator with XRE-family HTH domain
MNLSNYIEKARVETKTTSNAKLAYILGLNPASISQFLSDKALPADSTILKLAALAGIPPEVALVDVSIWRNKNNPEALRFWESIRAKIAPEN